MLEIAEPQYRLPTRNTIKKYVISTWPNLKSVIMDTAAEAEEVFTIPAATYQCKNAINKFRFITNLHLAKISSLPFPDSQTKYQQTCSQNSFSKPNLSDRSRLPRNQDTQKNFKCIQYKCSHVYNPDSWVLPVTMTITGPNCFVIYFWIVFHVWYCGGSYSR